MRLVAVIIATFTLTIAAGDYATAGRVSQGASKSGDEVTVVGKVVDAACYMIHPSAATVTSHKECGAACIARGVPLAIANETDNALYFPADGNKQLAGLIDQRVRVMGNVAERREPMELKMAVGDKNEMVVRVDGGYKVISIESLVKAPVMRAK